MISKFIKKIAIILPFYILVVYFISTNFVSVAINDCTIVGEEIGCCAPGTCSGWLDYCFVGAAPNTKCTADFGKCNCSGVWCNSAQIGTCNNGYNKYQCDTCCCTVTGGCDTCNRNDDWCKTYSNNNYYVIPNSYATNDNYWSSCTTYDSDHKSCKFSSLWCTKCCEPETCEDYCGPWSTWSPCDCNTSKKYRTRYCDTNSLNCPELDDESCTPTGCGCTSDVDCVDNNSCTSDKCTISTGSCSNTPTPVNGVLSGFTACSPSCDSGTQTATCTQEASCGGTSCAVLCSTAGGTYNSTTKVCTKNCSTSCPPKGYHDGAECIDDEGPNLRKIRVWGWACDKSDYSKPLTIHSYFDGTYSTGGDFIEPAGLADDPGETGIGTACGGFSSHRFNYISTASYPSGDHSVYSFAINYGSHPSGNPLLTLSPRDVTCCSPAPGNLGLWSTCSAGTQTSTCTGWYCGGSCSVECGNEGGTYNSSTNICTRPCLYVEGNIWSDDNGSTVKDNFEKWRDSTYLSGCSTSKVHPSFTLNYTGETGNQIKGWWCHVTAGAYYRGSTGVAANIEPGQPHTFTLSDWPDGYKPKSWVYNHPGYSTSGDWSGLGPFSTSSIIMPTSGWTNVHWELQQQKYNLTIKVKDIPPETPIEYSGDSCTLDLSVLDNLSDATVIISSATGAELCNKTTDSNGEVTCGIWVNQGDLNITVRKRVSDEEVIRTYNMVCPSKSNSFIYNPGDVTDGDSKTELVGLQESYKESWVSAVDSDIFANEVDVTIPLGTGSNPAGYVKALLNSFNNITGGFVFSNDQVLSPSENTEDEGTIYNLLFEDDLGGRAENLDSGGFNHNSKWLESFTFEAPANATEISNFTASLDSGVIYKGSEITTLPTTYALSGTGVAVLYIDNDLTINNDFTTSSNGRLLLVVNGSVTISEGVGTDVSSFMLSQDPNIEAGIIASGKIEFESIGGSIAEDSHDDPIMVSAPLITRDLTDGIIFSRDLYTDNNVTTPAESAKAFNKYLYLLSSLEREKSQDNLYFTGVTTYDLDWEYIY